MLNEIELLQELVAIPSVSGTEERVARHLEDRLRALDLEVRRDENSVTVLVDSGRPGPTLGFISHLDVVPPGNGWTRDPFVPVIEEGRLYGRGSGDAKGPVAAMLAAAWDLAHAGSEWSGGGRLFVILGYGEETKDTSMGRAVAGLPPLDACVVGEPTNLQAAVAQRGLMMAELIGHGDQRHAGYAADGDFRNAITELARDLSRLDGIVAERVHPILGTTTVTATMLTAGVSRNVTPPVATAVLDIRSTPSWDHRELAQALEERLHCEFKVTSDRLVPCETPADSRLLAALARADASVTTYGSPTCSDWVFVRHTDAIKIGPGTSRRSHTADESIDLVEMPAARALYTRLALEYLR